MKFKNFSYVLALGLAVVAAGCGKNNDPAQNPAAVTAAAAVAPGIPAGSLPVGCYNGYNGGYPTYISGSNCPGTCPVGFIATAGANGQQICSPGNTTSAGYYNNPCMQYPGTFFNGYGCQQIGYTTCQYGTWSAYYQGCVSQNYWSGYTNYNNYNYLQAGAGYIYYHW